MWINGRDRELLMINSRIYLGCLLFVGVLFRIYNSCNKSNLSLGQRRPRERVAKAKKEQGKSIDQLRLSSVIYLQYLYAQNDADTWFKRNWSCLEINKEKWTSGRSMRYRYKNSPKI